jgi:hypothetical protein
MQCEREFITVRRKRKGSRFGRDEMVSLSLLSLTSVAPRSTKACNLDGGSGVFLTIQQQRGDVR